MKAIAVAPAKVILFGEHFVVGGNSALSMAINLPTQVSAETSERREIRIKSEDLDVEATFSPGGQLTETSGPAAESTLRPVFQVAAFTLHRVNKPVSGLKIEVKSRVPIGMGLGSSAATAVATVSAISAISGSTLSKKEIFEAAYSLERIVHGHPSGVDQATVTYGGLIRYRKGRVEETMEIPKPPLLMIGNTGKRRSTGEFVGRVTKMRQTEPEVYQKIAAEAQNIAENAMDALRAGEPENLGSLMNENQRLLKLVGVSSPELESLISAARSAGALGAKLTGGGGGGCMIALIQEKTYAKVSSSIQEAGGQLVPSQFVPYGVETSLQQD